MSQLVLIRHAQVIQDPDLPIAKWSLSPEGRRSTGTFSEHPALLDVVTFYSSPEPKALVTAEILAGARRIRQVADLRELDRGAAGWVGSQAEYVAMVEEILTHPDQHVRGCEGANEAQQRIVRAIDNLVADHPGVPLAVVSHGLVLTLYLSHLLELRTPSLAIWHNMRFPDLAVVDPLGHEILGSFGEGNRLAAR